LRVVRRAAALDRAEVPLDAGFALAVVFGFAGAFARAFAAGFAAARAGAFAAGFAAARAGTFAAGFAAARAGAFAADFAAARAGAFAAGFAAVRVGLFAAGFAAARAGDFAAGFAAARAGDFAAGFAAARAGVLRVETLAPAFVVFRGAAFLAGAFAIESLLPSAITVPPNFLIDFLIASNSRDDFFNIAAISFSDALRSFLTSLSSESKCVLNSFFDRRARTLASADSSRLRTPSDASLSLPNVSPEAFSNRSISA
jgi:hypothetical protein